MGFKAWGGGALTVSGVERLGLWVSELRGVKPAQA